MTVSEPAAPEFYVVEQGDLVPREAGRYTSFPCLCRDVSSRDVLLVYRTASFDPEDERPAMAGHGLDGSLYLKRLDPGSMRWSESRMLVDGKCYEPGVIDGILTNLGDRLILFFRRYPNPLSTFYTSGPSPEQLALPREFPLWNRFKWGAEWGRVVPYHNCLLQVCYGSSPIERDRAEALGYERPYCRPALWRSMDGGETWQYYNWITPDVLIENRLVVNETALLHVDGTLYAIMRTGWEAPSPLYLNYSKDGGETWSEPRFTGLYGEAPVWYTLPSGEILMGFRGYANPLEMAEEEARTGGVVALAIFDRETGCFSPQRVVETYRGHRYDGGYMDMVWLEEQQRLLVVYYYSDDPEVRFPWLRYSLLEWVSHSRHADLPAS